MNRRAPYRPRIADALLAERLAHAGAVVMACCSNRSSCTTCACTPARCAARCFTAAADEGAKSLLRIAQRVDSSSFGETAFLAVVTSGGYAYRRDDGVYVIPASCLAP